MKFMPKWASAICCLGIVAASSVSAQPLTGKEARRQLFDPAKAQVEMVKLDFLTPEKIALLSQVAQGYAYYAAVAIAPDEDLLKSEATMLVANQHSVEAAARLALDQCDAARKGGAKCVVAAVVRPKNWQERPLQMSVEATIAMGKQYGKSGSRAMAVSPVSGAWAVGKGDSASTSALQACAAKGAQDCIIVVAD